MKKKMDKYAEKKYSEKIIEIGVEVEVDFRKNIKFFSPRVREIFIIQ